MTIKRLCHIGPLLLLALTACDSVKDGANTRAAATSSVAQLGCQDHIELKSAAHWAAELGQSETVVLATHRINLWESPSPSKGRAVGKMLPGSRAVILERRPDDYRVQSPLDQSIGWVSTIQVERTLSQDVATREACK